MKVRGPNMNTLIAQVTTSTSGNVGAVSVIGSVVWLVVVVAMIAALWKVFQKPANLVGQR
jgi:hypothetical protein